MSRLSTVYFNSKFRTNSSGLRSDCLFDIAPLGLERVSEYYIQSATIPYSYYLPEVNFVFGIIFGVPLTATVPAGQYDINAFMAKLALEMGVATGGAATYNIVYDEILGHLQITQSGGGAWFLFTNQMDAHSLNVTGFSYNDLPNANTIVSTQFINLQPFPNIYIQSSRLNVGTDVGCQKNVKNTTIAQCPVNAAPGGIIIYRDTNITRHSLGDANLNQIDLRLVDEDENLIDLNGKNWTCSIVFRHKNM